MRVVILLVTAASIVLGSCRVQADDTSALNAARLLLQTGDYGGAITAYEAIVESDADDGGLRTQAVLGLSRAYQQRGLWDAAATVVAVHHEKAPNDAAIIARQAELDFLRGKYESADKHVAAALERDEQQLLARLIQAHLAAERGEFDDAVDGYRWFVRYYNSQQPADADALLLVGEGSVQYARWKSVSAVFDFVVNTLTVDALADDESCWQASLMAGELLLEKSNKAQAKPEFADALAINPRAAEVFVAQGQAALLDNDIESAIDLAGQALKINPALPSALRLAADASIAAGELKSAMTFIEQARIINPIDQRTMACMAGVFLLDDGVPERAAFEAIIRGEFDAAPANDRSSRFVKVYENLLSHCPKPGIFLTDVGEILDGHRKYAAAEVCFRQAIEVMPQLSRPRTSLGMLAMRTGDLEEAQSILDAAFKADPFHIRVSNMRKVLKQLAQYESVSSDHFVIRVPQGQRLLGEAMSSYLEETYDELTAVFGFEPETRTQFEVFGSAGGNSAHQWFSARMVGLPWVQTIGASTGMIVAMASPNDNPEPFNWARVVRHEFVHILTLQQTRFNIPHWYTEALAVRTEGVTPPEWDTMLLRRVPAGDVFTLADINSGFQRPDDPEDWQMAYCQSWLYAKFIAERYGDDAHAKLLDAYSRNLSTERAISEACGVDIQTFEADYSTYLNHYVDGLRNTRIVPPLSVDEARARWRDAPTDRNAQADLAWALWNDGHQREAHDIAEQLLKDTPNQPLAIAIVAEAMRDDGDAEKAEELLTAHFDMENPQPELLQQLAMLHLARRDWDKAGQLWKQAADRWPREPQFLKGLAAVMLRQNGADSLQPILIRLAELDADDLLSRKKLAIMAHDDEDWDEVIRWATDALHIDITDESMHRLLAEAYEATGDDAAAKREQRILEQLQ